MKMRRYILFLLTVLWFFSGAGEVFAGPGAAYSSAMRHIKKHQPDFAMMDFRTIVRDFPKSRLVQRARFAIAEYCYDQKMYAESVKEFTGYIQNYPDSKANVFAKAYLLKIIQAIDEPSLEEQRLFEEIQNDFFSKPLFLLFREYKETSYRSPMRNRFAIRYYIDNIEVYRNGSLFIKAAQ